MKKIIFFSGFVLVLSFSLFTTSCQEDCANCRIYTIEPGGDTSNVTSPQEYCGEDLDAVDGKEDTDPSGVKTVYVCD